MSQRKRNQSSRVLVSEKLKTARKLSHQTATWDELVKRSGLSETTLRKHGVQPQKQGKSQTATSQTLPRVNLNTPPLASVITRQKAQAENEADTKPEADTPDTPQKSLLINPKTGEQELLTLPEFVALGGNLAQLENDALQYGDLQLVALIDAFSLNNESSKCSDSQSEHLDSGWPFSDPISGLRAQGGRNKYLHPRTGERMPSVTSVLGLKDKPALTWHAIRQCINETFANPYNPDLETVDEAKVRFEKARWGTTKQGTKVHKLIEQNVAVDEAEEPARGFLAAAYDAMNHLGLKPVAHEAVVWSDDYAGAIDMLAVDSEGRIVVVDWKTTTKDEPVVYADSMLQAAAYANANLVAVEGKVYDAKFDTAMVVSVSESGRWCSAYLQDAELAEAYKHFSFWLDMTQHNEQWESKDFNSGGYYVSGSADFASNGEL